MKKNGKENELRRVSVASSIGSFIEWYDFYIYSTAAALVFPKIFFPTYDPLTGTLVAFATFGAGFIARPFGAAVFGHFGDKLGRKSILVISLLMMGIATTLMGAIPSYQTWGVWAPLCLVLLRLVQGFAVGGEYGGAVLMAAEHAPKEQRGRYTGLVQAAVPAALAFSSALFFAISHWLTEEQFVSWGWRIPFLLSITMVGVGYHIRARIDESPVFSKVRERDEVESFPLLVAFRDHWKSILLIVGSYPAGAVTFFILMTFNISFGIQNGVSRSNMLLITMAAALAMSFLVPFFARIADRVGHRNMFFISMAVMAAGVFPLLWSLTTGNIGLILLGYALPTVGWSIFWAPLGVLYAELFGASVRYSGLSIGYMLATVVGGATPPLVATALYAATGSITSIAAYMLLMFAIGTFCMVILRVQGEKEQQ